MAARRSVRHLINSGRLLGFCSYSTWNTSTRNTVVSSGGGGVLAAAAAAAGRGRADAPYAAAAAAAAAPLPAAAATAAAAAAAFQRRPLTALAEPAAANSMERANNNASHVAAAAATTSSVVEDESTTKDGGGGCCGGGSAHHHHHHHHHTEQPHSNSATAAAAVSPPAPAPAPPPPPQPPLDRPTAARLQAPAPAPAPGAQRTFYKRKLPCPPAIEFSSAEGRAVFQEALAAGTMNGFFKLIEQLSTQDEPAFCGLASLAMVLNALAIDPRRPWKGAWRWFHEKLLDCCLPLDAVASGGIALSQAACLAKCNGARVELYRAGTFSLEEFRAALLQCASSGDEHVVVSYSRRAFLQTGDGHFSPIGGVHAGRDLALILDTARFKYPPHWVPVPLLYEAMQAVDAATGKPRGYLRLGADGSPGSVLFTLDVRGGGNGGGGGGSGNATSSGGGAAWRDAARFGHETAPAAVAALARAGAAEPRAVLERLVASAPLGAVGAFVAVRFAADACAKDRCVPHAVRAQVLQELRATPLYQMTAPILAEAPAAAAAANVEFAAEKLCILLLLLPPSGWPPATEWASREQHAAWHLLLETSAVSILESEVGFLRRQFEHLGDVLAGGGDHEADACGTCNPAAAAAAAAGGPNGGGGGGGGEVIEPVGLCGGGHGERAAGAAHNHDKGGAEGGGCCH